MKSINKIKNLKIIERENTSNPIHYIRTNTFTLKMRLHTSTGVNFINSIRYNLNPYKLYLHLIQKVFFYAICQIIIFSITLSERISE